MKPSRDISRLIEIMMALRDPNGGCPWDLKQDFASIAPYTIEEAYEVADAIERGDMEDLRLELGDLLLQSIYHAQMANEAGAFDFGDVVEGITAKMIRRHPHVFGTEDRTAAEYSARGLAEGTWERIKAEEKAEAAAQLAEKGLPPKAEGSSILDSVPSALPALTGAFKLQSKAAKVGFDWNSVDAVFEKLDEELGELHSEIHDGNQAKIAEEIGDLLFTIANLARHLKIDPEFALRGTNRKFRDRFAHVEKRMEKADQKMNASALDIMEEYWIEAKTTTIDDR